VTQAQNTDPGGPSDAAGTADQSSQGQPVDHGGPPDIIAHRINPHFTAGIRPGSTTATTPILYHNGPVMAGPVNVYVIWDGNWTQNNGTDNAAGQQIVRDFLNGVGGSPYFYINTTYSVGSSAITGAVTLAGEATDTGSQGTKLRDATVLAIVKSAITTGKLPKDANGVYFVLTSSNVSENSGFCNRYCGWHTRGTISGSDIKYSFVGNAARCITACAAQSVSPNGNPGVDGMISVVAHELEEAVSDPDLNAWYDSGGAENADKCAWTFGQAQYQVANGSWANMNVGGRDFLIQRNLLRTPVGDFCAVGYDGTVYQP